MSSKHNPASKKNAKTTAKAPTDPIGSLIARAQKMKPASLDAFLEGQDTADLRQMHARLLGEQAGPRTSPATLAMRIKTALTTAAKEPKPVVAEAAAAATSVAEEAAVVAEEPPAQEPAAVVEPAPIASDAPTAESASNNDPVDAVLVQAVALAREQGNQSYVHQMEEAMADARRAVSSGADPKTCSDAIAAYHDGETDRAGFLAALEAAVAAAANVTPVNAPAAEPAPMTAAATDEATTGHTDATVPQLGTCDRCGRTDVALRTDGTLTLHDRSDGSACNLSTPTRERDGIDILISRAESTTPEALPLFLEATPAKDLRAMLERLTGQKTSGRLSPASAIERITAALAKPAEKPASESAAGESSAPAGQEGETAAQRDRPARDLPPVGTVIVKSDRNGAERVRCVIVESGVLYNGTTYKSLSAAAIAAAHGLGLTTKQLNGWAWWGIAKPAARPAKAKGLDLNAIARVWTKYRERIEGALKDASAEDKSKLHLVLNAHSTALLHLAGAAAEGEAKAE